MFLRPLTDFDCVDLGRTRKPPLTQVGIKVGQKFGTNLLGAGLGEDVPEAQRLVAGARDDRLAVGRHGEVEHPVRVAGQLGHLHERRVLPHQDLVLRVAVCRDLGAKKRHGLASFMII